MLIYITDIFSEIFLMTSSFLDRQIKPVPSLMLYLSYKLHLKIALRWTLTEKPVQCNHV